MLYFVTFFFLLLTICRTEQKHIVGKLKANGRRKGNLTSHYVSKTNIHGRETRRNYNFSQENPTAATVRARLSTAVTPSWLNHGPDKRSWFSRPRPLPAASALCRRRQCLHEGTYPPEILQAAAPSTLCTHMCGCGRRDVYRPRNERCVTSSRFSRGDNKWPAMTVPTKRGGRV